MRIREPIAAMLGVVAPALATLAALLLAACSTVAPITTETAPGVPAPSGQAAVTKPPVPGSGGYYLNDGPGDNPPPNLDQIPDATPKREVLSSGALRPYTVMGQNYVPMTELRPYKVRGVASWYGRRYHGLRTSSGEIYDMYAMTAAHPLLPIPSYARVTNVANQKSVIVRVNDRGPFHADRLIDLSYTAAYKLGVLAGGNAMVEVETIIPGSAAPTVARAAATPAPKQTPAVALLSELPVAVSTALLPAPQVGIKPNSSSAYPAGYVGAPSGAAAAKGLFLQLGAFSSQENADNYITRLRAEIDWLAPALRVYPSEGLFRVHAGPYANPAEARTIADRISEALGIKPIVLTR